MRRIALERGRKGYVGASDGKQAGQIHHSKAGRTADGRVRQNVPGETKRVEDQMVQQLHTGLPALRRWSHQERFRSMFDRLAVTALEEQRNGEWRYLKFLQVTSLAHPGHQGKHQPPGP